MLNIRTVVNTHCKLLQEDIFDYRINNAEHYV